MKRSESIEKLAEALAAAQGQIEAAVKDKENPHFRSRYADLASIWDACRGPLSTHGLAVIQTTEPGKRLVPDGPPGILLETMLTHSSGQWISGVTPVYCDTRNPQAIGSALTYARRYGLAAMVGVCPDDDDAEAAMQPQREQRNGRGQEPPRRHQPDNRQRQRQQSHPTQPPTPAPADDWLGYISDRAVEAQGKWKREMDAAHVDTNLRVHPDFQMPSVHEITNHFVSHAINSGAIKQEDVSKDGKPGVRDPGKSKAAMVDLYRKAPKKIRQKVDAYFAEKEQFLRVKLGMDDLDPVPAGIDSDPAEASQELQEADE